MAAVVAASSFASARAVQGRLLGNLWRQSCLFRSKTVHVNVIREMSGGGHKRTMDIIPSNFEWRKFKDHLHFYVLLGLVPVAALVGSVNLFIGPAELADIPEGYEPKHWEYHKHPISRFIARYLLDSPEKSYERHLHFLSVEHEKIQMRKLEQKIKLLVGDEGKRYDSKRWYYIPVNDRATQLAREVDETERERDGYSS
jgi:NADH dehydrogenase (ubiquinone) 1 beta subcomplex subunit 5